MQKLLKVSIITVVLLVPVLVFLFLKQFGSNEFNLPIYYNEGHPLPECSRSDSSHKVSAEFIFTNDLHLPLLAGFEDVNANEFLFDLTNVLDKYPEVKIFSADASDLQTMNCQLVLGEDQLIEQPIANKFVLIDDQRRIRGYFQLDELDDIDRLDMELDILLNY